VDQPFDEFDRGSANNKGWGLYHQRRRERRADDHVLGRHGESGIERRQNAVLVIDLGPFVSTGNLDMLVMGLAVCVRDNVIIPVGPMCPVDMDDWRHRQGRDGKTEQGSQELAAHLFESYVGFRNGATEEYMNASSE
jgi:hypothetical protein